MSKATYLPCPADSSSSEELWHALHQNLKADYTNLEALSKEVFHFMTVLLKENQRMTEVSLLWKMLYISLRISQLLNICITSLTRWWLLCQRCLPAPCVGWCCCVPLPTDSCETPVGCCIWWLEMGPLLEAMRGFRSLPAMHASSDPFVAFGLSGCEEQEEKMKMQLFWRIRS